MILDELFRFPCVMVDGDNEQSKKSLYSGSANEPELDIVIGEAAYPYFALLAIKDAWMPTEKSFHKALEDGEFEACLVTFANISSILVPWPKAKFEKEYRKFVEGVKKNTPPQIQLVTLTEEQVKQLQDEQGASEE